MDEKRPFVLDASMGWPPCFCPIEGDLDGECSIITGINFIGEPPPGSKIVAVIHERGQEAVEDFCTKYEKEIARLRAEFPA